MSNFMNGVSYKYYFKNFLIYFSIPVILDSIVLYVAAKEFHDNTLILVSLLFILLITIPCFIIVYKCLRMITIIRFQKYIDVHHVVIKESDFIKKGNKYALVVTFRLDEQEVSCNTDYIFNSNNVDEMIGGHYFVALNEKLQMPIISEEASDRD